MNDVTKVCQYFTFIMGRSYIFVDVQVLMRAGETRNSLNAYLSCVLNITEKFSTVKWKSMYWIHRLLKIIWGSIMLMENIICCLSITYMRFIRSPSTRSWFQIWYNFIRFSIFCQYRCHLIPHLICNVKSANCIGTF